jgi:hypothetical protein
MNAFTSLLIFGTLSVSVSGCASDLSSERAGEVDSPMKAFVQHGLDRRREAYLVCVYEAEATGGYKNEVEIHAKVVNCIRGKKRVGESFAFRRGSDSGAVVWPLRGDLFYVFLDEDADGRLFVDAQDPEALWEYSAELNRIVEKYKREKVTRSLDRRRAGQGSCQFGRHWPPASVSSIVKLNQQMTE